MKCWTDSLDYLTVMKDQVMKDQVMKDSLGSDLCIKKKHLKKTGLFKN